LSGGNRTTAGGPLPNSETPSTTVDVNGDLALQLPGVNLPEEDPSARWMM
jgi:hypothetical protein